jgi:hypothetical protein
MQPNVHCFMLFNTILLNVAQHVSSLYKAHLQGLFCCNFNERAPEDEPYIG